MTGQRAARIVLALVVAGCASARGRSAARDVGQSPGGATVETGDARPIWLENAIPPPLERAHWGIAVYDLDAGRWLALHHADRYFEPASNLKLVVTAVGLERLGPDFAWRTSVYGTAPIGPDGALDGDLVLYGRGDPNLSARFADSRTAIFEELADSLATRGLRRVTGRLLADESYWDADHVRGDWAGYDLLWWYAAPVGALGFNDNSIDFEIMPAARAGQPPRVAGQPETSFWSLDNRATTGPAGSTNTFDLTRDPGTNHVVAYGSLPLDAGKRTEYFAVVDPAGYAGAVFRDVLAARGIDVIGETRTVSDDAGSPVAAGDTVALAAHVSPPLSRDVEAINGRSQNWHAEQLVKTLGKEVAGQGSWAAGLDVERETLARLGVDTTAFLLRDASGLSSVNLVTPRAVVDLLRGMARRPAGEAWAASLPVAGRSGSLARRFVNTAGEGRIHAKTGYIENVYSLSGFLTTLGGRRYAFSVIVNQTGAAGASLATATIDRLVNAFVSGQVP